jgi:hypothetical protein
VIHKQRWTEHLEDGGGGGEQEETYISMVDDITRDELEVALVSIENNEVLWAR